MNNFSQSKIHCSPFLCGIVAALFGLFAFPVHTQPIHAGETSITVEYFSPAFTTLPILESIASYDASYSAAVTMRFRTGETTSLFVIVPFNETKVAFTEFWSSMSPQPRTIIRTDGFGNVGIGSEYRSATSGLGVRMLIGIPTMVEDRQASALGPLWFDPMHWDRYAPNNASLNGDLYFTMPPHGDLEVTLHVGLTTFVPVRGESRKKESFAAYGVGLAVNAGIVRIGGVLDGRTVLTEEEMFPGESKSFHVAEMEASIALGPLHPTVTYRIPLDNQFDDYVKSVVGLGMRIEI